VEVGYRVDLLVEQAVVLEVRAQRGRHPPRTAPDVLKLTGLGVTRLKDGGIHRLVRGFPGP
jgi:hypothetical protein